MDTFAQEPLPPSSLLRELPNTILTPHAIGHPQESINALPAAAIENVSRILSGELPPYLRNPDVIPRWRRLFASEEK
jgi:phosphoglycerate dehydrogenase-like enzyme